MAEVGASRQEPLHRGQERPAGGKHGVPTAAGKATGARQGRGEPGRRGAVSGLGWGRLLAGVGEGFPLVNSNSLSSFLGPSFLFLRIECSSSHIQVMKKLQ